MVTDKVNINFNLRYPATKKNPERKLQPSPVLVVVRWQGKKFKANTGATALPAYWDDKKQTPKPDYRGADTLQKRKMRDQARQEMKDLQSGKEEKDESKSDPLWGKEMVFQGVSYSSSIGLVEFLDLRRRRTGGN